MIISSKNKFLHMQITADSMGVYTYVFSLSLYQNFDVIRQWSVQWCLMAGPAWLYEYSQKTAQFCLGLPYTLGLLLMSLAKLIFQRCVKPFALGNCVFLMGTFLFLKSSVILLAFFLYFSICFHVSTNNLIMAIILFEKKMPCKS